MAVLVDQAVWEWRGALWAHLVSDTTYDELHQFAQRLGKRRLGFQGDHYDIESVDRDRAVDLGAEPVDSSILVRRLVASGLRRRHDKPAWDRVGNAGVGEALIIPSHVGSAAARLGTAVERLAPLDQVARSSALVDARQAVVLFDWHGDAVDIPDLPVDEVWAGAPRVDGERSLELFVAREHSTSVRP